MTPEQIKQLLDQHIPSITDLDDSEIWSHVFDDKTDDSADLAIRTCHCGIRIDGFYEYVDHLKDVFSR